MKRKVVKVRNVKDLNKKLAGEAVFRITGPSVKTGERVTVEFTGTRKQAEQLELV